MRKNLQNILWVGGFSVCMVFLWYFILFGILISMQIPIEYYHQGSAWIMESIYSTLLSPEVVGCTVFAVWFILIIVNFSRSFILTQFKDIITNFSLRV